MPGRKKVAQRSRHGARKWIEKVLATAGGQSGMTTSAIHSRAEQLSGTKLPSYSVYQALRTLVRRKVVSATRHGRELSYRIVGGPNAAPSEPASKPSEPASNVPVGTATLVLHKMAPGEITVLHLTDTHVETASNVDGKLLLERHPRPRK